MKKVKVNVRNDGVVEFWDPNTKKGGLIGFISRSDGTLVVEPYRLDDGVMVNTDEKNAWKPIVES